MGLQFISFAGQSLARWPGGLKGIRWGPPRIPNNFDDFQGPLTWISDSKDGWIVSLITIQPRAVNPLLRLTIQALGEPHRLPLNPPGPGHSDSSLQLPSHSLSQVSPTLRTSSTGGRPE